MFTFVSGAGDAEPESVILPRALPGPAPPDTRRGEPWPPWPKVGRVTQLSRSASCHEAVLIREAALAATRNAKF